MTDRELLIKAQGEMVKAADLVLYCRVTTLEDAVDSAEVRSELRRVEEGLMHLAAIISNHLDREGQERDNGRA